MQWRNMALRCASSHCLLWHPSLLWRLFNFPRIQQQGTKLWSSIMWQNISVSHVNLLVSDRIFLLIRMPVGISAAISVPFLVIAFNVNRISFWVQEELSPLQETSFGIWFLDRLGWLSQNKKDQLIRKRENRLKKQSERKGKKPSFQKPDSSANLPAEEKSDGIPIGGKTFRDSNFSKNRILSINSITNRRRLNDEENQNLTSRVAKSKTFPLFQISQKNREFKPRSYD